MAPIFILWLNRERALLFRGLLFLSVEKISPCNCTFSKLVIIEASLQKLYLLLTNDIFKFIIQTRTREPLNNKGGGSQVNIYLVCNAGMSTSILVRRMQEAAANQKLDHVEIEAFSVEILDEKADMADIVLLGPQIRHMLGDVRKLVAGRCPVELIDMKDYGTINGQKVLEKALKLIN